jgi:hypothetical protein
MGRSKKVVFPSTKQQAFMNDMKKIKDDVGAEISKYKKFLYLEYHCKDAVILEDNHAMELYVLIRSCYHFKM